MGKASSMSYQMVHTSRAIWWPISESKESTFNSSKNIVSRANYNYHPHNKWGSFPTGRVLKKHSIITSQADLKTGEEYRVNYSGLSVIISSSMRVRLTNMNCFLAKVNPYSSRNTKVTNGWIHRRFCERQKRWKRKVCA